MWKVICIETRKRPKAIPIHKPNNAAPTDPAPEFLLSMRQAMQQIAMKLNR
jgi:hypothetical protein